MLTRFLLYLEALRVSLGRFMHRLETDYKVDGNLRRERHRLLVRAGRTEREAAGVLSMKREAAVSRQLERLRQRLCADAPLRPQLARIKKTLWKTVNYYL